MTVSCKRGRFGNTGMKARLTPALKREFNRLVDNVSSRDQMTRISARLRFTRFVEEHGKEACDHAFASPRKKQ